MTKERLMHVVPRFVLMNAFLFAAAGLPACTSDDADLEEEDVVEIESAIGPTGSNNFPPFAVDSDPLERSVTNAFHLTSPSNADPLPLCEAGTVTSTGCTLKSAREFGREPLLHLVLLDARARPQLHERVHDVRPAAPLSVPVSSVSVPVRVPERTCR